jgi:hypothetical protein
MSVLRKVFLVFRRTGTSSTTTTTETTTTGQAAHQHKEFCCDSHRHHREYADKWAKMESCLLNKKSPRNVKPLQKLQFI